MTLHTARYANEIFEHFLEDFQVRENEITFASSPFGSKSLALQI